MPTQQTIPVPTRAADQAARPAAAASRNGDPQADWPGLDVDLDRFRRDLGPLCDRVAKWAAGNSDKVRAVYADAEYVKVTFYVVTDKSGIDFELWDEWFDLDDGLIDDFPVGYFEMTPVTPDRFNGTVGDGTVGGRRARLIYGDA